MLKKTDLFFAVMMRGILGAIIGIISGFALGMLIWTLLKVADALDPGMSMPGDMLTMISFMSMAIGGLIGAFLGAQVAFKEKK